MKKNAGKRNECMGLRVSKKIDVERFYKKRRKAYYIGMKLEGMKSYEALRKMRAVVQSVTLKRKDSDNRFRNCPPKNSNLRTKTWRLKN